MIRRPKSQRGIALLSMILALAIVGILTGLYMGPAGTPAAPGAKPWPQVQTDRARSSVCVANRNTAKTQLIMDQIDNYHASKTPQGMIATAKKLPSCPGEGKFYIAGNEEILCTQHIETPKFHEMLNL